MNTARGLRRGNQRRPKRRRRGRTLLLLLLAIGLAAFFLRPDGPLRKLSAGGGVEESLLILANKEHRLPEDYVPSDLTEPDVSFQQSDPERRQLRREAASALEQMFAGAKADGHKLIAVSGYRSYASQKALYKRRRDQTSAAYVEVYIARPGASEHQTGLAMDLGCPGHCDLEEDFAQTDEGHWIALHAHEYGFVIRYPQDKTEVTGYAWEPWHVRYVGKAAARTIYENGWALEEYLQSSAA